MLLLKNWAIRQIDFSLYSPQATIESDLYLKLPPGTVMAENNAEKYVLLLHKIRHGQK